MVRDVTSGWAHRNCGLVVASCSAVRAARLWRHGGEGGGGGGGCGGGDTQAAVDVDGAKGRMWLCPRRRLPYVCLNPVHGRPRPLRSGIQCWYAVFLFFCADEVIDLVSSSSDDDASSHGV